MADIPTAAGTIAFAQNAQLYIGDDRLILMRNAELNWTRPETRYAHGLTRTYGHGPPDAELTFTVSASAGIYKYLMSKSDGSSGAEVGKGASQWRGVLADPEWEMKITGDGGIKENLKMKGKLRDVAIRKPDGDNSEVMDLDCVVRITDDTINVTAA